MERVAKNVFIVTCTAVPLLALFAAAFFARWPLLYASIGIGIGVILSPFVRWMELKLRLPLGLAAFVILLIWVVLFLGIGYLIYALVWEQFGQFVEKFPELMEQGRSQLARILESFPSLNAVFQKTNWGALLQGSVGTLGRGLRSGFEAIAAIIYIPAISIYLAMGGNRYERSVLSLFPVERQPAVKKILSEVALSLRRWIGAQLIAMTCVGICASIGFVILGIQYWAVLGLLTAVLDIIPFVGPTIAAVCALIVTLGSDPEKAPWVIANFVIVEHIESNLVVPLVLRGKLDLPPVHLLTLMLIFSQWFGLLGILVAPPFLVVARTLYVLIYLPSIQTGRIELKPEERAA